MSGLAGIAKKGKKKIVGEMLDKIAHRGKAGKLIVENDHATFGIVWGASQASAKTMLEERFIALDEAGPGHFAKAETTDNGILLTRDRLGVQPLYYGRSPEGDLCFGSEVKALLSHTRDIRELQPGSSFDGMESRTYYELQVRPPMHADVDRIARDLRKHLEESVRNRMGGVTPGSWLSGGLDSSTMAALAKKETKELHTFAVGFEGAPDLDYAREVARHIGSTHHEFTVTLDNLLEVLPDVIYQLESFDALLVRSSVTNYLVARLAAEYVTEVFSGEGGDELFAGYSYLKELPADSLPGELIDITNRLHNTALQRVDRSASAHGTVPHVGFLSPSVVDFATQIPAELKLRDGVEKWILRKTVEDLLPPRVLNRTKAKFWEGAGVGDILSQHAEELITDAEFSSERSLPDGSTVNTKEELFYYRLFRDRFGDLSNLDWMGRTKGAPRA